MRTIAFVTPGYDPRDIRRGSGTFYYLAQELERQGCKLHFVGPLIVDAPLPTRFIRKITRVVLKQRYPTYLDPWFASARCRVLAKQLAKIEFDIILTNDHGISANNSTGKPVIVYTDVMLPRRPYRRNSSRWLTPSNLPHLMTPLFRYTIKRSLTRASLCVFPAEWQLRDANNYGISPSKLCVIPFGANIPDPGSQIAYGRDINDAIRTKHIDLLFVGKDWQRKGGKTAIQVTAYFRSLGLDAVLHVVGTKLEHVPDFVIAYGLLDKTKHSDWELLNHLYETCHVFLFPTSREGSVIVPREASAYGLPTLAYRIDGVIGAVEDSVNGVLLDPSCDAGSFVKVIQFWFKNPLDYKRLAVSSRHFYETKANWTSSVARLMTKINECLAD